MENSSYLIILSINEGQNFPLNGDLVYTSDRRDAAVVLEARFNDDVLRSDTIAIAGADPQLRTELAFQVDRKSLHLFRIERKPIKLQAFIEYAGHRERQFVGYIVLDLRNASADSSRRFEWKTLLNPKYKGSSQNRPQVSISLTVSEMIDLESGGVGGDATSAAAAVTDGATNYAEIEALSKRSLFDRSALISRAESDLRSERVGQDLENDINVRLKNGYYHIWESKCGSEGDCKLHFALSIIIAFAENLRKLSSLSTASLASKKSYHFRYTFLGTTVKTEAFRDLELCDFPIERTSFKIAANAEKTLRIYFDLHPTLEIQFCDETGRLYGFVAISLSHFTNNDNLNFNPVEGSYMLLPDDESTEMSEPFPIIGVSIELKRESQLSYINDDAYFNENFMIKTQPKITENQPPNVSPLTAAEPLIESGGESQAKLDEQLHHSYSESKLSHYCFAIDLRSIRLTDEDASFKACYFQFSYAFFGFTDSIKTFPTIELVYDSDTVIPHGFCAFNFATTSEQLEKTFRSIPLIIEAIEQKEVNTLIGISSIDLSKTLPVKFSPNKTDSKQVVNFTAPIVSEENKTIAQIQVIMFLQNFGSAQIPQIDSPDVSVLKRVNSSQSIAAQSLKSIDELLMDTAMEIELWKEKQIVMFKEQLKQKESDYFNGLEERQSAREIEIREKMKELSLLEDKLKTSLDELKRRESAVAIKEDEIKDKQDKVNARYQKLNDEISVVIAEIKEHYEAKMATETGRAKAAEQDKCKYQERVYALDRKLKEKEGKIKELEQQISDMRAATVSNGNTAVIREPRRMSTNRNQAPRPLSSSLSKKIIVTREPVSNTSNTLQDIRKQTVSPIKSTKVFTSTPTKSVFKNVKNGINRSTTSASIKKQEESDEKIALIDKLVRERKELIERGVGLNDPIIVEIDKHLVKFV